MKKAILVIVAATLILGTSCIFTEARDKSPMRKVSRETPAFTGIKADGGFEISVSQGEATSVSVEAGSKLLDRIRTEVHKGILEISSDGNLNSDSAMRIRIVMPLIKTLDCGGACELTGQGTFKTEHMKIEVSGAASVDLEAEMESLELRLDGAARLKLKGKARDMDASLSGASQLKALNFESEKAVLSLDGASDADVNVKQSLSGKVSGASNLLYSGEPEHQSVESSGAGSIQKAHKP